MTSRLGPRPRGDVTARGRGAPRAEVPPPRPRPAPRYIWPSPVGARPTWDAAGGVPAPVTSRLGRDVTRAALPRPPLSRRAPRPEAAAGSGVERAEAAAAEGTERHRVSGGRGRPGGWAAGSGTGWGGRGRGPVPVPRWDPGAHCRRPQDGDGRAARHLRQHAGRVALPARRALPLRGR